MTFLKPFPLNERSELMPYPTLSENPEDRHMQIRDSLVRHITSYFSGGGEEPDFAFDEQASRVREDDEQCYSTWLGQVSYDERTADLVLKIQEMNPETGTTQIVLKIGDDFETTSNTARAFISRDYPNSEDRDFLHRAGRLIRDQTG